jgi:uncharacterized protein (DUF58 family)
MLTARGWWFLFLSLLLLAPALLVERAGGGLAVLAFAMLGWFLAEWFLFALRVRFVLPSVRAERRLLAQGRPVPLVWAGSSLDVIVTLTVEDQLGLPFVIAADRTPMGAELVEGWTGLDGRLTPDEPIEIAYRIRRPAPGELRFEGVALKIADLQGFFYYRAFIRTSDRYPVLPALADAEGGHRTDKRFNLLPPPGVHRMRRAGSGSELLDLRDYRPGDPPKMIAWKPSARRDRLITKEFETEVPVRCTLFVDTSQSVRLGPEGQTALARVIAVAGAAAQASLGNRDLVGLTLFDETGADTIAPARTKRHLIEMLARLATAAKLAPVAPQGELYDLMRLAYPFAQDTYPDLMRPGLNATPMGMFWRPILDSRWGFVALALIGAPLLLVPEMFRLVGMVFGEGWLFPASVYQRMAKLNWLTALPDNTQEFLKLVLVLVPPIGWLVWLVYGLRNFINPRARLLGWRKRLAALLAARGKLGPGATARLQEDDGRFAEALQTFLADHHVSYPVRLYDPDGRYLFASTGKVNVLAAALLRSVGRGRDNELFVLLADLFELDDQLDPLLKAVRVARARHHQVIVVCPWLPGIPPPEEKVQSPNDKSPSEPEALPVGPRPPTRELIRTVLYDATVRRYHRAFDRVRRAFGRLGVLVVRADADDSPRLILERLERLRGAGRRR